MSKRSFVFALGVAASACVAAAAVAQNYGGQRDPAARPGVATAPAPQLNPSAAPVRPGTPFAGAERASDLAGSQSAMAAPVGPGSGMTFVFGGPADISFAMGINQPQPGSYTTASGPEPEADPEGVPPMLGADLAAVGPSDLPPNRLSRGVTLGQ